MERRFWRGRYVELRGRLADQCCDGMLKLRAHHGNVGILHLLSFELCFRLSHIRLGSGSTLETILCELQRIGISLYGVVQKLFLCVGTAQLEVVDGQFGVQAQTGRLKIGGACLSFFSRRAHGAADSSP